MGHCNTASFVDHLQQTFPDAFEGHLRWQTRLPADLGQIVCQDLNRLSQESNKYCYEGIEAAASILRESPLIATFLIERDSSIVGAAASSTKSPRRSRKAAGNVRALIIAHLD